MKERIHQLKEEIRSYEEKSGRPIHLIGVTKYSTIAAMEKSLEEGIEEIGESRAQDLLEKIPHLTHEPKVHFIGHLQRNKVRQILPYVDLIQSADSIRLLREINRQAENLDKIQDILIQVNIAREEQKYGFLEEELEEAFELVEQLDHIQVKGMMMMAPFVEDPEEVRHFFKEMALLFDLYRKKHYNNVDMTILSMGMSSDYRVALEEGSTMIRIGSAIYKEEEQ